MKFLHVGIPTKEVKGEEVYVKDLKVYCTSPENHPYSVEYVRFESCSSLPEILKVQPHIAYKVDSIEEATKDADEVLVEPFKVGNAIITFIIKDNLIIELCQI